MVAHSKGFEKIVEATRPMVKEISCEQVRRLLARIGSDEIAPAGSSMLIDVREDQEWDVSRIPGASHIGKGVLERDIEAACSDFGRPLILYCGGGYRSVLAAKSLQDMGYTNVSSMAGGFRSWKESDFEVSN